MKQLFYIIVSEEIIMLNFGSKCQCLRSWVKIVLKLHMNKRLHSGKPPITIRVKDNNLYISINYFQISYNTHHYIHFPNLSAF